MTLQYTRLYEHIKLSINSVILYLPGVYILTANLMQNKQIVLHIQIHWSPWSYLDLSLHTTSTIWLYSCEQRSKTKPATDVIGETMQG